MWIVQRDPKCYGAMLLVAGCCIGAGMLGTPVVAAAAGFVPSSCIFFFCWVFMVVTGLLELEVVLWFKGRVNLLTMVGETVGFLGKGITWVLFAFLFYTLMVAYLAASGQLISDFVDEIFSFQIPSWVGSFVLSLLFGIFLAMGAHMVDLSNRLFMGLLILAYALLVVTGIGRISPATLLYHNWSQVGVAVPTMILAFGYHNLIPTLVNYLDRDAKNVRFAVVWGSLIPLLFYLVWQLLVFGLIPAGGGPDLSNGEELVTRALKNAVGRAWVVDFVEYFALTALLTSLLSVSLSFTDFLSDGLSMRKKGANRWLLSFLSLAPPLMFAVVYPNVFLVALRFAGAFGAVILFGLLPVLMVWRGRYFLGYRGDRFVPGGKLSLLLVGLAAIVVVAFECMY